MKKIKLYTKRLFFCTMLFLLSCESSDDFLTRVNPNTITPEVYWQTEADAVKWLVGTYSAFVSNNGMSRFFAWASVYRSDEYRADFGNAWGMANAEFTMDGTNTVLVTLWRQYHRTIFRANNAIQEIPLMEDLTEEKRNELLGEAEFLRGIAYFYLINLWKEIPLITTVPVDEEDFFPSQVSREVVWAQIEADFTNAKLHLDEVRIRDDAELGRATWGAAIGHLGKAYLYQEKWQDAADEFKELIDANIYDLVADYRDNGSDQNENNIESIFEEQFNWLMGSQYSTWRSRDGGPKNYASNQGVVEPWLVNTFLEETTLTGDVDPRALATLIFPHPESTLYGGLTYEEAYGDETTAYWKKYRNVESKANDTNGTQSSVNIRLMRFADILLMHAEAENEANGPTSEAQASFNRVRARANMASVDTGINQDDFRAAIRRERVLELSGEDNRWMDLKRWGILAERFSDPSVLSGENFDINRHEYYPIPSIEITTNPNLVQYADY